MSVLQSRLQPVIELSAQPVTHVATRLPIRTVGIYQGPLETKTKS